MPQRAILIALLPVALSFLWAFDANLLLLAYDAYLTSTALSVARDGSRTFAPGATF